MINNYSPGSLGSLYCFSDFQHLIADMPGLGDFPLVPVHIADSENLYNVLDWQRVGCRRMLQHYMNIDIILHVSVDKDFLHLGNKIAQASLLKYQ